MLFGERENFIIREIKHSSLGGKILKKRVNPITMLQQRANNL
jgi:hypothetical protein